MEGLGKSPVEAAIQLLNISRNDTNARLAKDHLELTRNPEGMVLLTNKETGEKQEFKIETLEDAGHERFEGAYGLLGETFGKKELDPKDIMADQMCGLRYGHAIETGARAVIFTISKNNEVVGTLDGALINLQDERGKFTGECIFMVFYIASKTDEDPKKNYRQYGLGRELMISAYEYANREAQARGMQLIGAAGECTYTSRTFWEKMDWRRAYVQDKDERSKNWKEVSYVQPPLAFDTGTGEVEEGAGDAPEHFMVNLFDKKANQTSKKLTSIVNGFYRTNNYIAPAAFSSTEAYEHHTQAITPHLQNFSSQLEDMKIRFLTEAEIATEKLAVEDYVTGNAEAEMLAQADHPLKEKMKTDSNF